MIYHQLGKIPRKRHTVFRHQSGEIYHEELMGSMGFSGLSSLLYHVSPPTSLLETKTFKTMRLIAEEDQTLRMRHLQSTKVPSVESATLDRTPLMFNSDVTLWMVSPTKTEGQTEEHFYRNAEADEVIYVSEGTGTLESQMGELAYHSGDYLIIPRGILHRYRLESQTTRFLIIESAGQIRPPKRYLNEFGQLLEHAPYCERDFRLPSELPVYDERGEFPLMIKRNHVITCAMLDHHPFDAIGWDGYYYPWAFSIHDFEPITGSLHQPPPVHQTFASDGFVICSFVPRLFDFHPDAIPAPYNHSNVMSDEVLYYANDEFMSRKGISYGSLTLHPNGIPHGPQPGRAEASIGKKKTNELAVMLDTFRPLFVTTEALQWEDPSYGRSWLESSE